MRDLDVGRYVAVSMRYDETVIVVVLAIRGLEPVLILDGGGFLALIILAYSNL